MSLKNLIVFLGSLGLGAACALAAMGALVGTIYFRMAPAGPEVDHAQALEKAFVPSRTAPVAVEPRSPLVYRELNTTTVAVPPQHGAAEISSAAIGVAPEMRDLAAAPAPDVKQVQRRSSEPAQSHKAAENPRQSSGAVELPTGQPRAFMDLNRSAP